MKLISVNWHDAWSHDEQCDVALAETLCLRSLDVTTVGYLVAEDDTCLVVARDYLPADNKVCGILHIPKGWIEGEPEIIKEY